MNYLFFQKSKYPLLDGRLKYIVPAKGWRLKVTEETVYVTKKGQVTIPIRFRKSLNIREGSKLLISQAEDSIVLHPLLELEEMAGIQAGKLSLSEALLELGALRKQDRY